VQGIYNYLGGIVRAEWSDPDTFDDIYQVPRSEGKQPFLLFKVRSGQGSEGVYAALLGSQYSVERDTSDDRDASTQVIGFLTDLWALESSAKTYPTNTTVSVTAP
jgi:hypothetical protein